MTLQQTTREGTVMLNDVPKPTSLAATPKAGSHALAAVADSLTRKDRLRPLRR